MADIDDCDSLTEDTPPFVDSGDVEEDSENIVCTDKDSDDEEDVEEDAEESAKEDMKDAEDEAMERLQEKLDLLDKEDNENSAEVEEVRQKLEALFRNRKRILREREVTVQQLKDMLAKKQEQMTRKMKRDKKELAEEKKVWASKGNKFYDNMLKADDLIVLEFSDNALKSTKATLLSGKGGGQRSFFMSMFSGRVKIPKVNDNTFYFDRSGKTFQYVLDFLKGRPLPPNFSPEIRHQLLADAHFFEMWELLTILDPSVVPVVIGSHLEVVLLNRSKVLNNLGKASRLGKMVLDESETPPYVLRDSRIDAFNKYVMKKLEEGVWFVNPDTLSEEEKEEVQREEEVHEISLTTSPFPLPLKLKNKNCSCGVSGDDNMLTKVSGGENYNGNTLSMTSLPMSGRFKFTVTVMRTRNSSIYCGIAPSSFDINTSNMFSDSGWFFFMSSGNLYSGPPTSYGGHPYGDVRVDAENGVVEVVVDRDERTISFVVNGEDKGIAYKDVFGDGDDLRACVILYHENDKVHIGPIEAAEPPIQEKEEDEDEEEEPMLNMFGL
eukprot:m.502 g.502  ORF g.502 m.502 type:complete len:551 (-) comp408_c0_seq1:51-1703(-)